MMNIFKKIMMFILGNNTALWNRLDLDYMTPIGVPRWFLFFTIFYAVFIQLFCNVISFALKIINDYAFATKQYSESGSAISAKYAIDSLQVLISNIGYFSILPFLAFYLIRILKSFKK